MMTTTTILSILAFSVATNLDNFGICVAYGVSGTRINASANLIIAGISALATGLSIGVGALLGSIFGETASRLVGIIAMLAIGGWLFLKAFADGLILPGQREIREVFKLHIKPLGMVISILKEPLTADQDQSKSIDLREALFLGAALAINCLASGVALGLVHLPVIATSVAVGAGSYLSAALGCRIGNLAHRRWNTNLLGMLGGLVLMILALFQIF